MHPEGNRVKKKPFRFPYEPVGDGQGSGKINPTDVCHGDPAAEIDALQMLGLLTAPWVNWAVACEEREGSFSPGSSPET